MTTEYRVCPLCGFEFDKTDTVCEHGCPLSTMCKLVRCPSCEYEFPEEPQFISWFGRIFGRKRCAEPTAVRTVADLKVGERAVVIGFGGGHGGRHHSLAVFGLVPEADIIVLQQRPACVVRVGETELALDGEIAREIVVQSPGQRVSAALQADG